jgi:recombination protein RecA
MAKKPDKKPAPKKAPDAPASLMQTVAASMDSAGDYGSLFGAAPPDTKSKKSATPALDRRADIDALKASINKQFNGKAVLRQGEEITNVFMLRRPTGVTSLDLAIGGGLPAGGLTQIIGKYSSGKSYLCNKIMATAQETYGEDFAGAACMTEQRYDKYFAKKHCGLRVACSDEEIAVHQHGALRVGGEMFTEDNIKWFKDQVGYFTEAVGSTAEELLEIACQQVESNLFQVLLIDSFGALLTKAEAEAEDGLEQKHYGGAANVITAFMHRLHAALNLPDKYGRPNMTTVIGINQYRDNVGRDAQYRPMKVAGGNALAHGKLLDIHIEQGSKIWHQLSGNDKVQVGKEINWEIMKGKAGCHDGGRGTYKFFLGEHGYGFGVDIYSDLLVAGLETEVIEQSGAWYSYKGERLGQGAANVATHLYQNPVLIQQIRTEIFKKAGLNFIIKEGV